MRCRGLVLLIALAACAGPETPSGRWAGTVTPQTPSPRCKPSRGVANLSDGQVTFAPDEGTWVLAGTATKSGEVVADLDRIGANRAIYETNFTGRWTADSFTGIYKTPQCTFTVKLAAY